MHALDDFAAALAGLLATASPDAAERAWTAHGLEDTAWAALAAAERSADAVTGDALERTDRQLLALLDHFAVLGGMPDGAHLLTFRRPVVERLQHAAAAALVASRYGTAGLAAVVRDPEAPRGRRYHALLALARRHPSDGWPVFEPYLVAHAHHAFVGVAVEAARYYPALRPATRLVGLFEAIRGDLHLRAFLGPRLLASLQVLRDPVTVPLCEELAVGGHTSPDPTLCEVTQALVLLRALTGRVPASAKYGPATRDVLARLDEAEAGYRGDRDRLRPATVL